MAQWKRVSLRLWVGQDRYGVAVSDTGPGIPEEEQAKVFEPFYRASTRGEVEGTGLGLALVKRVLEAHGGEVRLKSRLGRGSTFLLLLPRPRPGQRAPVGRLLLLMVALIALARASLPAGEGAVLGKGVRRKLLPAPLVRPIPGPQGEVVFRLLLPEGARGFRVEVWGGQLPPGPGPRPRQPGRSLGPGGGGLGPGPH